VNILRNLIRKYLSNPPDSRFQNITIWRIILLLFAQLVLTRFRARKTKIKSKQGYLQCLATLIKCVN
jgi:hypothetical protein